MKKTPGDRRPYARRHTEGVAVVRERLLCPDCGALMYVGPKPKFAAISCPSCKKVWEMPRG